VVSHRRVGNGTQLVQVAVEVRNIGNTLIRVVAFDVRLQNCGPFTNEQVAAYVEKYPPVSLDADAGVAWRLVGRRIRREKDSEREIEPGESEVIQCDFLIRDKHEFVRVYSYVKNRSKRWRWNWRRFDLTPQEIGWVTATFHDISHSRISQHKPAGVHRNGNTRRLLRRNGKHVRTRFHTPTGATMRAEEQVAPDLLPELEEIETYSLPDFGADELMQNSPEEVPDEEESDAAPAKEKDK
jgi:hypothetical protein